MEKPLDSLAEKAQVISFMELSSIEKLKFREKNIFDDHDDDHDGHEDEHEGHEDEDDDGHMTITMIMMAMTTNMKAMRIRMMMATRMMRRT